MLRKFIPPPKKKSFSEQNKNFGLSFPTGFDWKFQLQNLVDHMFEHNV